jgi:nicotinate-nucleotide pyrophosphorylase (carboxylating)
MRRAPEKNLNQTVAVMQSAAEKEVIARAYAEDVVGGTDLTSEGIFSAGDSGQGIVIAKEKGVLAGLSAAQRAFQWWGSEVQVEPLWSEGQPFNIGDQLLRVHGPLLSIFKSHRTALSLLSHLSGVASNTRHYIDKLQPFGIPLFYTRKALPGLRTLEKQAVALGGGTNHRLGLYDSIKVMDIHVKAAGSITCCVDRIRAKYGDQIFVEVEVRGRRDLESISNLLGSSIDRVWLDNVPFDEGRKLVAEYGSRVPFGASGGFNLETIEAAAEIGVSCVSVGASLVLDASPIDLSLKMS